jgi:EpsI family protein
MTGVPALLQGNVIAIPGSAWRVAEACSGINYMMASLAIGYIYAGLAYSSWSHRIGLVGAAAVLPIIANAFRVYATILIAYLGANSIASGMEHYVFGWVVFSAIVYVLIAVIGAWGLRHERPTMSAHEERQQIQGPAANRLAAVALIAVVVGGLAPSFAFALPRWRQNEQHAASRSVRPSEEWNVLEAPTDVWRPAFVTPASMSVAAYQRGDAKITLFVAAYDDRRGFTKVVSPNGVIYDEPWRALEDQQRVVMIAKKEHYVRERVLSSGDRALLVWNWYWVDGSFTSNDYLAKVLLAKARLLGSRVGPAAIAVATSGTKSNDEAREILKEFVNALSFVDSE